MMMNDLNSLVHQKEGAQGKEEEVRGWRKGGPTPGANAPTGPIQSGVSDARNSREDGRWCGTNPQEGQRGLGTSPILSR